MKKITQVVIPVAGLGTRFIPFTKAVPKEMLPILNKPTIQYIVEEAVNSGIEEIIFVISKEKLIIKKHFEKNENLEKSLKEKGKLKLLDELKKTNINCKFKYVFQKEPLGLGDSILCAKEFIKDDYFAIMLGDDVTHTSESQPPVLKQLIAHSQKHNASILGVGEVPLEEVSNYGVVNPKAKIEDDLFELSGLVEKPKKEDAPSNYSIMGRYVLSKDIFEYLEKKYIDPLTNEQQITDSIMELIKEGKKVYSLEFNGIRFDMGSIKGYLEAQLFFAKENNILD